MQRLQVIPMNHKNQSCLMEFRKHIIAMKNERGFILAKFMFADKWKAREEWR